MKQRSHIPVFSAFSLLLLVGIAVLWVRSRWHGDLLVFYTPAGHLDGIASDRAGLLLCATEIPSGPEMRLSADAMRLSSEELSSIHEWLFVDVAEESWHFLGFRTAAGTTWNWNFRAAIVPYWALVILLAIAPLNSLRKMMVRRRRKNTGRCPECGYDLRHSPERCPECGAAVSDSPPESTNWTGMFSRQAISASGVLALLLVAGGLVVLITLVHRGRRQMALPRDPLEEALLTRRVGQIDLAGMSVRSAAHTIARSAGVQVAFDGIAPQLDASQPMPGMTLHDVNLVAALRAACEPLTEKNGQDVQLWVNGSVVHVAPDSAAAEFVRSYPLGNLLQQAQSALNWRIAQEAIERQTGGVTNQLGPPHSYLGDSAGDILKELIAGIVRTDDWEDNGGSLGDMKVGGGRLWLLQTQEGHAAVQRLLAMLASPATEPATLPAENPHADLQQKVPELNLDSTTLEKGIDALRQATHANILVYWKDLEAAGVKRDTPIKLHLWDVTLDRALGAMLAVAGADFPRAVQDGIIVIASPERLRDSSTAFRIYDVRDLIQGYCASHHPVPVTVRSKLTALDPDKYLTNPADDGAMQLTRIIEDMVDADSWRDNGGAVGSLYEFDGRLIITQTPSAHRRIAELLKKLREGGTKDGQPAWPPPSGKR